MCIKLNDWRLTKDKERGHTVRGTIMGVLVCIKNVKKIEYIRIGTVLHKWGIQIFCEYSRMDTRKELPE